ncbi:MAG: hypothetical protein JRD89_01020 [Deltaproteobacteria bacterium]|nr:hypothetical protein [Deltaproteobacteria bacterium]
MIRIVTQDIGDAARKLLIWFGGTSFVLILVAIFSPQTFAVTIPQPTSNITYIVYGIGIIFFFNATYQIGNFGLITILLLWKLIRRRIGGRFK